MTDAWCMSVAAFRNFRFTPAAYFARQEHLQYQEAVAATEIRRFPCQLVVHALLLPSKAQVDASNVGWLHYVPY